MLKNLLFFFIVFHCPAVDAQMQRIQTSSNRKYLQTMDGQPFFYPGDTGWDLIHRLNKEEADYYLQNRKEKGFNVIQAVLISAFDNGPESENYYGNKPFNNKEQLLPAIDKGSYDYWQHADHIVNSTLLSRFNQNKNLIYNFHILHRFNRWKIFVFIGNLR